MFVTPFTMPFKHHRLSKFFSEPKKEKKMLTINETVTLFDTSLYYTHFHRNLFSIAIYFVKCAVFEIPKPTALFETPLAIG